MKSDFFRRGPRMVHKFGETEQRQDPFSESQWDLKHPVFPAQSSGPCEVQEYGERFYRPEPSPVQKPTGGFATLNGPEPDVAEGFGRPFPVGTKRRSGPPRTDK